VSDEIVGLWRRPWEEPVKIGPWRPTHVSPLPMSHGDFEDFIFLHRPPVPVRLRQPQPLPRTDETRPLV
jgi:hypothetical protein